MLSLFFVKESLGAKVAMFNQYANKHKDKQSKNPFSSGLNIEKPKFSKEEYGRYVKFKFGHYVSSLTIFVINLHFIPTL